MTDPRRSIPGVDSLLSTNEFARLLEQAGRERVIRVLRTVLDQVRAAVAGASGGSAARGSDPADPVDPSSLDPSSLDPSSLDPSWFAGRVAEALERGDTPSLRRVINATGVVLHTNLGRAPLADAALRAVQEAAGYGTLEYDVEAGTRGSRYDHCVGLLQELTGAAGALVVNNNAAAVVLVLNTLADGKAAVISRGELVEIGGSFRVPEIMARSGAVMREVGSTNRTHLKDYAAALDDAALIFKVHRSNFRVEGFTAEVGMAELSALARDRGIPLVHDLGSGALLDMTRLGLPPEPTVAEALAAGADAVTLSGDKLLGGPQAGIIVGDAALVDAMRANPLCRALRPDKLTLAALEATLRLYRDPDGALREVPVLRMLAADAGELEGRAQALARRLADALGDADAGARAVAGEGDGERDAAGVTVEVAPSMGAVGGGAYPGVELPGHAVTLTNADPDALARRLRLGEPPVVARVKDGRVWLDVRTVPAESEAALAEAVAAAVVGRPGETSWTGSTSPTSPTEPTESATDV